MKITYNDKKEYVLTSEEDIFLGSLKFEKWSSSKAEITTQFGEFYNIEPKGFWGTSMGVSISEKEIAEIKMNWQGQIVIDMLENGEGMDFLLQSKSIWTSQYVLLDHQKTELLIVTPDYKWKQGHYNFKVDVNPEFTNVINETHILLTIYGVLYVMSLQGAGAA